MTGRYTDNESLAESASNVLDGTATSDDIDRLLASENEDWQEDMRAYALTSALLSDKEAGDFASYNLLGNIRDAIDAEDTASSSDHSNVVAFTSATGVDHKVSAHKSVWSRGFGSLAVAASVAFVVISGGSYLLDGGESISNPVHQVAVNPLPIDVKPLQHVNVVLENKRLQAYLRQHAEQSTMVTGQGMLPMARVVSYPIGQE